jgi:membrane associated rhomboid family serine protease
VIPIRDDVQARRVPLVTWALIAVNAAVFVYEIGLPHRELEQLLILRGLVPARLTHPDWAGQAGFPGGAYLTLVTSQFLHGGWLHLLSNMWVLWIFGNNVEDRMGHVRFLLFYLLCGAIAGTLQWRVSPDVVMPTIGASGAIAGVLGAYFFLFPRARVLTLFPILFIPLFFELPAVVFLFIWFLTQLLQGAAGLSGGAAGGIAWWAHIGGFGGGVLLHRAFLRHSAVDERSIGDR